MKISLSIILYFTMFPLFLFSQADSLIIGNGGGFSGKQESYIVTSDYIKKSGGSPIDDKITSKRKKKTYRQILQCAEEINKKNEAFVHPYNMYKYLFIYQTGKETKYTWGDPQYAIPTDVSNFYNYILEKIVHPNFKQ